VLEVQLDAVAPNAVAKCGPSDATQAPAVALFSAKVWVGTPDGERD